MVFLRRWLRNMKNGARDLSDEPWGALRGRRGFGRGTFITLSSTMFYDLNVPWTTDHVQLQQTLAFLDEREWLGLLLAMIRSLLNSPRA